MAREAPCTCPPLWSRDFQPGTVPRHHPKCALRRDTRNRIQIPAELLSDEWLDEARADAELGYAFSAVDTRRLLGHIDALTRALTTRKETP